jgi:hypothetical protein
MQRDDFGRLTWMIGDPSLADDEPARRYSLFPFTNREHRPRMGERKSCVSGAFVMGTAGLEPATSRV